MHILNDILKQIKFLKVVFPVILISSIKQLVHNKIISVHKFNHKEFWGMDPFILWISSYFWILTNFDLFLKFEGKQFCISTLQSK